MKHLAIIADGNRRWAAANDLPYRAGYVQGLMTIERCCDWALENGIEYLTVYCFSTENWNRPQEQVGLLMDLAKWYFDDRRDWYVHMGIRVRFKGRRDRFDNEFLARMNRIESDTRDCSRMTVVICVDYGGRDEIQRAINSGARTVEEITSLVSEGIPDPDVVLRTGGEYRLSNFLLWQSAYSELFFSPVLFPDLDDSTLSALLSDYQKRKRTYGS